MQYITGTALLFVGYALIQMCFDHKEAQNRKPRRTYVQQGEATEHLVNVRKLSPGYNNSDLNRLRIRVRGRGRVARATRLLLRRIEKNPEAIKAALSASKRYSVPIDVLLAHWYQESSMTLGGDKGGAGGRNALAQIKHHQNTHRRKAFLRNERDLRKIARHCGYDLSSLQGSSTGALGPMQFMPSTWMFIRMDANGDGKACPTDLADAIHGTALKLRNAYKKYRSWDRSMLAYGGVPCAKNRAYVARSRPIRPAFCEVMRRATKQHIPCSIEPPQHLSSR